MSIWYSDLRALERSNWFFRSLLVIMVTLFYPIMCVMYLIAPKSQVGTRNVVMLYIQKFSRGFCFSRKELKDIFAMLKFATWS